MGCPGLIRSGIVLCDVSPASGCSDSPSLPDCAAAMTVSVHLPSTAEALETTEAALGFAGIVSLSCDRFFQTRVAVVNLTRGNFESCDARATEDACPLSWSTLGPLEVDIGANEFLVGGDAPEDSALTTILVTRIATGGTL